MCTENNGLTTSDLIGSYDYGKTYQLIVKDGLGTGNSNWVREVSVSANASWAVITVDTALYRSSNGGRNWTKISGTDLPSIGPQ